MRDIAHGILHGLVVAGILLTFSAWAPAQTWDPQGGLLEGPRPAAALESMRATGTAPTPNQSYLAKQMQEEIAFCLSGMVGELSNGAHGGYAPRDVIHTPNDWRVDNQTIRYRGTVPGVAYTGAYVKFSKARWDPEQSNMQYGTPRVAQNVQVDNDAKTKLIQNDSDAGVDVDYSEAESLTNSFSTSVTHGMTMDLTVSSTTTVSGEYAGVSAEESVTAEFGISKTSEETTEKSQEGTHETAIDISFTAAPGEYYLVTVTKDQRVEYQAFTINGVMDFDFEIGWGTAPGGRQRPKRPTTTVHLQGVAGLSQFAYGYDTRYPEMSGFMDHATAATKNGISCVTSARKRTLNVSGTNQASLQNNADYHVESLGHSIPPHLRHLPVDDADNLSGGGQ